MPISPLASSTLIRETGALLTRLDRVTPFALGVPMVTAAAVSPEAARAIERYLVAGRMLLRQSAMSYLRWLRAERGAGITPEEAQRRFSFLKLKFNVVLTQFDIFADVLNQRSEHNTGVWLSGLDIFADDALRMTGPYFTAPPVVTYLDRGHGAAIRRARTRLPGGGENPVAVVRVPRERMIGSGIASSLVHEVGHQGAALLDLVDSLRRELQAVQRRVAPTERQPWVMWERWISEIIADFWSVAMVGVSATQGLIGVVSLPRAFVFRVALDDPHPFPWIRVRLSAAVGEVLYPDPQWRAIADLWESFYPRDGLPPETLRLLAALEATMPRLVRLLVSHRPAALTGKPLAAAFPLAQRQPARLRARFVSWRRSPSAMASAMPSLVFAALGQAKQDGALGPAEESRIVADLLVRWALRRAVLGAPAPRSRPPRSPTTSIAAMFAAA